MPQLPQGHLRTEPIAGPLFRAALKAELADDPHQRDNRKLLALIAAFADAGESSPTVRDLAKRVGFAGKYRTKKLDKRLRELERDGALVVLWGNKSQLERNRYELTFGGGGS